MFCVGRDLTDHLVPTPSARMLKAPSNLALNTARKGTATTSLSNMCQGLTTLTVKNFFPISNLNLPFFSLKPSPLVLSLHTLIKSPSPALLQAPPGTGSCSKVSLEPPLLQAEQPQLFQPSFIGMVFQPSNHCCGLLWTCSSRSMMTKEGSKAVVSSP